MGRHTEGASCRFIKVQKSEGANRALNKALDDGTAKLSTDLARLAEKVQCIDATKAKTILLKSKLDIHFDQERKASLAKLKEMQEMAKRRPIGLAPITGLTSQFAEKMRAKQKFYEHVSHKLDENIRSIESRKAKLQDEIENIDRLKSKIDPTKTLLNSDSEPVDDLKKSAQDLIDECDKYREIQI